MTFDKSLMWYMVCLKHSMSIWILLYGLNLFEIVLLMFYVPSIIFPYPTWNGQFLYFFFYQKGFFTHLFCHLISKSDLNQWFSYLQIKLMKSLNIIIIIIIIIAWKFFFSQISYIVLSFRFTTKFNNTRFSL